MELQQKKQINLLFAFQRHTCQFHINTFHKSPLLSLSSTPIQDAHIPSPFTLLHARRPPRCHGAFLVSSATIAQVLHLPWLALPCWRPLLAFSSLFSSGFESLKFPRHLCHLARSPSQYWEMFSISPPRSSGFQHPSGLSSTVSLWSGSCSSYDGWQLFRRCGVFACSWTRISVYQQPRCCLWFARQAWVHLLR